jgi:hypothetical protein
MSVWKYVKVDGAWRYKAAIENKGKIVPNMVRVNGQVEFHDEGTYYFRSGRQWIRLDAVPTSTQEARELLQAHDLAVKHGIVAADQPTLSSSLRDAIEPYLEGYAPGHQTKTVNGQLSSSARERPMTLYSFRRSAIFQVSPVKFDVELIAVFHSADIRPIGRCSVEARFGERDEGSFRRPFARHFERNQPCASALLQRHVVSGFIASLRSGKRSRFRAMLLPGDLGLPREERG